VFARDQDVLAIARSVAIRIGRRLRARWRSLSARARGALPPGTTPLAERFLALCERGCRVLLVFDDAEAMRFRFEEELARDRARLAATHCFRLELIPHANHIFLPLASQEAVGRLLARWLLELARDPER
jgi:hypothetical protein